MKKENIKIAAYFVIALCFFAASPQPGYAYTELDNPIRYLVQVQFGEFGAPRPNTRYYYRLRGRVKKVVISEYNKTGIVSTTELSFSETGYLRLMQVTAGGKIQQRADSFTEHNKGEMFYSRFRLFDNTQRANAVYYQKYVLTPLKKGGWDQRLYSGKVPKKDGELARSEKIDSSGRIRNQVVVGDKKTRVLTSTITQKKIVSKTELKYRSLRGYRIAQFLHEAYDPQTEKRRFHYTGRYKWGKSQVIKDVRFCWESGKCTDLQYLYSHIVKDKHGNITSYKVTYGLKKKVKNFHLKYEYYQ
jgi:hypothetical protein